MFSSLTGLLAALASGVAAIGAALWARARIRGLQEDRRRIQATHDAIEQAGQRLEAARKATVQPIDPKRRTDFERQP